MSTSLLYHTQGLRGYRQQRVEFKEGAVRFVITQNHDTLRCGNCGSRSVQRAGQVPRRFRSLPIGSKPVWIELAVPRLWCAACGKTRQAQVGFADPKVRYTRPFEHYALELSRHMTIQAVARHLGVSWGVVKDIQKRYLQRRFAKVPLKDLRQIATDMSPAYLLAVAENPPEAVHVLDRFHVVKLFNDQLAGLRREVQRSVEKVEDRKLLKGTLWLLLKNPENLNETRNERHRLEEALRINQPLATAYYMKEDLRQFWAQPGKRTAARFLKDWTARAQASGVAMLQKFAKTIQLHRTALLAWYDYPISTGPLEGTNNKIKTLQRQAYGYRDQEFFRLKIYAIHKATYALVG